MATAAAGRGRVYLDYNATTPLRLEAREAMIAAMDVLGNPSSVHTEGRAAKAIIERSRVQLAALVGCDPQDIVWTSGATEAANVWFRGKSSETGAEIEHDAVWSHIEAGDASAVPVDGQGQVQRDGGVRMGALQLANSETGVLQSDFGKRPVGLGDVTQALGKQPVNFATSWCDAVMCSAHKLGGPKGSGALILNKGIELTPAPSGGGQEMGRRAGTENVIGIAGFGAAAEAAKRDLDAGLWDGVKKLRKILENAIEQMADGIIWVGKETERLPNTTCFAAPGWKGETQVMAMDLAGFAVSAGSACSSGKVRESRVLRAIGYDASVAQSAIRVSLGLDTTEEDVLRFAEAWAAKWKKHQARAA
ncbi:MAG: cysteine desulfurase [Rhodobacteraceae bacterium]|nr:cysteine desulfurase [Paracoccaceae bacterium]